MLYCIVRMTPASLSLLVSKPAQAFEGSATVTLPSPPARKLRLGIIGLSPFAVDSHLSTLGFLKARQWPIEVAALCDLDPVRRQAAATRFPAAIAFMDANACLRSGLMDAVLVFTQPHISVRLCETVAAHRLPFFVEKPAAPTPSALLQLGQAVHGLPAQVGYNRRFQLAAPLLRQVLRARPNYERVIARLWRSDRTEPIFYTDTLVHQLDLLLWLFGPLEVISVESSPARQPGGLASAMEVHFRARGGQQVTLDVRPAVGRSVESLELVYAHETHLASYFRPDGGMEPAEFSTFREGRRTRVAFLPPDECEPETRNYVRGFLPQLAAFCRYATGEDHLSPCSLEEAAACLQLRDRILAHGAAGAAGGQSSHTAGR